MNIHVWASMIAVIIGVGLFITHRFAYNSKMDQKLYIIRGISGSGKSTLAAELAEQKGINYYEADMYFMKNGVYAFIGEDIGKAHNWCYDAVHRELAAGRSVIVSNTFTRWHEMRDYVTAAHVRNIHVEIIHCLGDFGSVHNVPKETMNRQRARMVINEQLPQSPLTQYSTHLPVAEMANTAFGY